MKNIEVSNNHLAHDVVREKKSEYRGGGGFGGGGFRGGFGGGGFRGAGRMGGGFGGYRGGFGAGRRSGGFGNYRGYWGGIIVGGIVSPYLLLATYPYYNAAIALEDEIYSLNDEIFRRTHPNTTEETPSIEDARNYLRGRFGKPFNDYAYLAFLKNEIASLQQMLNALKASSNKFSGADSETEPKEEVKKIEVDVKIERKMKPAIIVAVSVISIGLIWAGIKYFSNKK
jgi:hypothetical protein